MLIASASVEDKGCMDVTYSSSGDLLGHYSISSFSLAVLVAIALYCCSGTVAGRLCGSIKVGPVATHRQKLKSSA